MKMLGQGLAQCGRILPRHGVSPMRQLVFNQITATRSAIPVTNPTLCQIRTIETERYTPSSSSEILVAQRKLRPVAPHLTVYRPTINYIASPLHRITGVALSGTLYLFALSYLAAPVFGWHIDSATVAAAFGSLPVAVKAAAKFLMAFPFTFHAVNGCGHLIWDTGSRLTKAAIVRQGWTIVGLSVASAGYLAFLL